MVFSLTEFIMFTILLWMGFMVKGSSALSRTDWATCRIYPDPHMETWQGTFFDFHGGCDVILYRNAVTGVLVYARLVNKGYWSDIYSAAIRHLGHVIEVNKDGDTYFDGNYVNDADWGQFIIDPMIDDDYKLILQDISPEERQFIVQDTDSAQRVTITRYHLGSDWYIWVDIYLHGVLGLDASGLCGTWTDSGNGMIGRDSNHYTTVTGTEYGLTWKVDPAFDPQLFNTSGAETCDFGASMPRSPDEKIRRMTIAEDSCNYLLETNVDLYNNCVFDVETTGDQAWAQIRPYIQPIPSSQEQCVATDSEAAATCEQYNGTCVWRCDESTNDCVTSLCTGAEGFDESPTKKPDDANLVNACACQMEKGLWVEIESTCKFFFLICWCDNGLLGWLLRLFSIC